MTGTVRLLVDKSGQDGAGPTFSRIVECIGRATFSIEIHMFVWRCDDIGNHIARALLEAACRGVKIHIIKDADALLYETIEMNRKPLLEKKLATGKQLVYKLMSLTFPDTYVQDTYDHEIARQLLNHGNVTLEWVHHTHSKYYIFDNEIMITGSINIEDRHRAYYDYMVELQGAATIEHFRQRLAGKIPFDESRNMEFILNRAGLGDFEIKPFFLKKLAEAKHTVYVEMAYIGDPDISHAIIQAVRRGVQVNMLFSREANVGNDINYHAMHYIARQCSISVYMTTKMIHSKLMMFDNETAVLGSANISVYSMQKGTELDVVINNNPVFLQSLREEVQNRITASEQIKDVSVFSRYNHLLAAMQQLHQKLF